VKFHFSLKASSTVWVRALCGGALAALSVAGLLLSTPYQLAAQERDVHAIASAVDEHYNHLRSLQAEFTETYQGAGAERVESGTLWLKKPGKMRWEYRSPVEKLFVSDGRDAWFYLPADKQAHKTPVKKLDDLRSPLAFMLGKTRLEKELQGLSLAPDKRPEAAGDVVLRGVPKTMADQVNQVLLEITSANQIYSIQIEQMDGSVTKYRFDGQKENIEVADRQFVFSPPAGVETVEGDFGQ
jgi:outer membrane lipoprotein carrier protein